MASKYDSPEHHHHARAAVNVTCVTCPMPPTTFIVVDPRHDHSLRIPRPDLSATLGTPNACNGCHTNRDPRWASERIELWYGHDRQGYQRFAGAFSAAQTGRADGHMQLRTSWFRGIPFVRAASTESEAGSAGSVAAAGRRTGVCTLAAFVLVALGGHTLRAQDVSDDGRVGAVFAHPMLFDHFSGSPYIWFDDQTGGVKSYRVAVPNIIYHARPWLQGWGGLIVTWKDDDASGDTRELRPYVGVKIFVPNSAHIHLFDWTRLEWRRTTNTDDDTVTRVWRLRTRPGVEFPLSANAWKPGSFYGLANTELFVEHDFVDAVRFMSGAGYIRSDRLRIEFQYVFELSRKSATDALAHSDNSFRLDFKLSFREGLLHRQQGPE